jgi:hypothetical protein
MGRQIAQVVTRQFLIPSPPAEVCDSPDQGAVYEYHILGDYIWNFISESVLGCYRIRHLVCYLTPNRFLFNAYITVPEQDQIKQLRKT